MRLSWFGGLALALVACAPGEPAEKNMAAVSSIPVEVGADDKADAGGKVVRESTFVVGEKVGSSFTAKRGWIAYPIELIGNSQVDISLSGARQDGSQQDTMFWIYGPKDANGRYPAQPFAYNDDETPGSVLGSRLYLTVPADGTYRILVSSWENYSAYPDNVSRGSYDLRVTCASGGFGACGAALSYEGESCWADTDCRAEPAVQGAHCEGEVTCPADVNCIWVNQGTCHGNYVWLAYSPRQCGANPWQQVRPVGDGVPGAAPEGELTDIDNYFEDQGFDLLDVGFAARPEPMASCQACNCPRGDLLVVKARAHEASRLVAQFGFTRLGEDFAAQYAPKQCGTNPWDDESNAAGSPGESQSISQWTASLGAPLAWVGYLYATEQRPVCRACACPRGDVLFAQPKDAAGLDALRQNGFGELYVK